MVDRLRILALLLLAFVALGCRPKTLDLPPAEVEYIAAVPCFACRDLPTLKTALDARKDDRETFNKMRTESKVIPIGKNAKIKIVGRAEKGKYAKVHLKEDKNDFWMLSEWIKEWDPEKEKEKEKAKAKAKKKEE